MDTLVSQFASSLADHDVAVHEVSVDRAPSVLDELLEPPVVGTPLDGVGVTLEDLSFDVSTDPTVSELHEAETGITPAIAAIADYGSVVLQGSPAGEEPLSLYPDTHVAVLDGPTIRPDMASAIDDIAEAIRDGQHSHVIATGPSATADMGALVQGAHGPKSVEVVVVTDDE